jgi:LPS sulfotransferase NodH
MTELDMSSARFDQRCNLPDHSRKHYIICSTQRSGSYLLCRQLINAGIGVPQEYFNPVHLAMLTGRWDIDPRDGLSYLVKLWATRTTPNGVWGTKLQWPQYLDARAVLDAHLLESAKFIFLYRSDLTAQAVSLHLSVVTGLWGFDDTKITSGQSEIGLDNSRHVLQCLGKIKRENEAWRKFFLSRNIEPFAIRYEDFAADQQGYLTRIARFLEVGPGEFQIPPKEERDNRLPGEVDAARRELLHRARSSPEFTPAAARFDWNLSGDAAPTNGHDKKSWQTMLGRCASSIFKMFWQ